MLVLSFLFMVKRDNIDVLKSHEVALKSFLDSDKFVLSSEFVDLGKLKDSFDSGSKPELVVKLLQKVLSDEKLFESKHSSLLKLFADWKGDLKREMDHAEGTSAEVTLQTFFSELVSEEDSLNSSFSLVKSVFRELKVESSKIVVGDSENHDVIIDKVTALQNAVRNVSEVDDKLLDLLSRLDIFIKEYEGLSSEFKSYKSVAEHFSDVIEGKGKYFSKMTIANRQKLLFRYMRHKEFIAEKQNAMINSFVNSAPVDSYKFSKGKDYSSWSLEEAESHLFKGEPRKVLPELLNAKKKPLSMASLVRTRVMVYKKLVDLGKYSKNEIMSDSLFRFWWDNYFTSGDACLYGDGQFRFKFGKNEVWEMKNARSFAEVSTLEGETIGENGLLSKADALVSPNWLVLLQGDKRLLEAYVNILFSLKSEGSTLMRIYLPLPGQESGICGRLWWLGDIGYSNALRDDSLDLNDGRFVGV